MDRIHISKNSARTSHTPFASCPSLAHIKQEHRRTPSASRHHVDLDVPGRHWRRFSRRCRRLWCSWPHEAHERQVRARSLVRYGYRSSRSSMINMTGLMAIMLVADAYSRTGKRQPTTTWCTRWPCARCLRCCRRRTRSLLARCSRLASWASAAASTTAPCILITLA